MRFYLIILLFYSCCNHHSHNHRDINDEILSMKGKDSIVYYNLNDCDFWLEGTPIHWSDSLSKHAFDPIDSVFDAPYTIKDHFDFNINIRDTLSDSLCTWIYENGHLVKKECIPNPLKDSAFLCLCSDTVFSNKLFDWVQRHHYLVH